MGWNSHSFNLICLLGKVLFFNVFFFSSHRVPYVIYQGDVGVMA